MKLEKLVDSVLHLHKEELIPKKNNIHVPAQLNFPKIETFSKNAVMMGRYYEFMTQAFYGGKLSDLKYFENSKQNGQRTFWSIKPDIIDDAKRKIGESKACVSGYRLHLLDKQLEKYESIQYDNPDSIVYFAVYRHIFRGIKSTWRGSEQELFKELSKKTMFSLVLPLSIILRLYKSDNQNLISRYDGELFDKCTSIKSQTLNSFLTEPKEIINQLGFSDNFDIVRSLSPKNFRTNKNKVKQFPIVIISDKNHEKWVLKFKKQYDEENPIPF